MAQTITNLQRQDALKKSETELLLKSLESRSSNPAQHQRQSSSSPPQRLLKSFTSLVHLQEPEKLRTQTETTPLTYQDQLQALQEQTVIVDTNSLSEMRKVYGSKRFKLPGAKMSIRKHHGPLKTYAERLKELKPAQSQAKVMPP